jgi:hypothetical protein
MGIIFGVPSLLDNIQAQTNTTNTISPVIQNQTAATAQNQTAATAQNQTAATAQNQTAATAQNQTLSQNAQVLIALDIPELKDNLMDTKELLANGEIVTALTGITDLENQFILLQNKPTFTQDIQKIKEDISKTDLKKALDDITKIQKEVIKAETEVFKAQLSNPELMASQQDDN